MLIRITRQSTGRLSAACDFCVSPPKFMSSFAYSFGFFNAHRLVTPAPIASSRFVPEGRRSMRVSGRSCFSLAACAGGFLSGAQSPVSARLRHAFVRASFRLAPVQTLAAVSICNSPSVHQNTAEKTAPSSTAWANPALNLAPFSRWTLRDEAAQRRLALR